MRRTIIWQDIFLLLLFAKRFLENWKGLGGMNKLRALILLFASLIVFMLIAGLCSEVWPIVRSQEPVGFQSTPESILEAIYQGRTALEQMEISHSDAIAGYKEKRNLPSGTANEFGVTDYQWKEIALQLMNLETGQVKYIKIMKVLDKLIYSGHDFRLELEGRPTGSFWNGYNTAYKVTQPSNWVILGNKYKRYNARTGAVKDVIYSPYSQSLHRPNFVRAGKEYLREDIVEAIKRIKKIKPPNINLSIFARGDKWVAGAMERIALIEQSDPYEVIEFNKGKLNLNPFERVYVTIFLNQELAFSPTVSTADASGLMQWTKGTWDNVIRKTYPWAGLPNFETGSIDHVWSIMASILLYNYNLEMLSREFKTNILDWREPEHYLAACYNGGPSAVIKAIGWALARNAAPKRWRIRLRQLQKTSETYYFLEKLDIAIKHGYGSG